MKKPRKAQSSQKSLPTKKHRPRLSHFARSLLREWRKFQLANDVQKVVVAVSGGADSVALWLALTELVHAGKLDLDIIVAHLDHKLRGDASDADARWVAALAKRLANRAVVRSANVKQRAARSGDNLEQAARSARYEFLEQVAKLHHAKVVLTAHSLNDQAETVLFNLIRGSGTRGLGGIEPLRPLTAQGKLMLARRKDTENYCRSQSIEYRVDQMNFDATFTRVRVRNELLPLLESFNGNIIETLGRTAEILREDDAALGVAAQRLLEIASFPDEDHDPANGIHGDLLLVSPPSLRRRALRLWLAQCRGDLRRLERAHIMAIERLLESAKSGRTIELPGGASVFRRQGMLHYRPSRARK